MPDGPLQARRRYPVHVAESDHHCHKRDLLCDWSVHLSGDPVQHARAGQRRERLHPGLRPVQWVRTAHSTAILHHTIDRSTAPPPHPHTQPPPPDRAKRVPLNLLVVCAAGVVWEPQFVQGVLLFTSPELRVLLWHVPRWHQVRRQRLLLRRHVHAARPRYVVVGIKSVRFRVRSR